MALNLGQIFYQLGVDTSGLNKADSKVRSFTRTTNKSFDSVNNVANKLKTTLGTLISIEALRRSALMADNYGLLRDRVTAVVGDVDKAVSIFTRLENISSKTGASLELTAGGFQKLLFAKETVKGTNEEMIRLTQSFAELGLLSGTAPQLLNAAMLQFSQGLISGVFQAQEFQSVLENVPAIAGEIAAGMGITVQELIKLKKEGKLVSEDVFRALVDRADEISEKAEKIPIRMSRGFARFQLGLQQGLAGLDESVSLTQTLGTAFFKAGEKLQKLPFYTEALFTTLKDVTGENNRITQMVGTFVLLQGAIIAVNGLLTVTNGLLLAITRINPFVALTTAVVVFWDKLNAASAATQVLLNTIVHLGNLDLTSARNEISKLGSTYSETLQSMKEQTGEGGQADSFIQNFLSNFDISNLDVVKSFYDNLAEIEAEAEAKRLTALQATNENEKVTYKKHLFEKLGLTKAYNDAMKTLRKQDSEEEFRQNGASFKRNIQLAGQSSKEFADLAKAIALYDIAVKTPQAIASSFTFGSSIGGPILGGVFAGVAAAAMAVQANAIASQSFTPRAVGGDVFPNQVYKVNENGPEMFSFGGNDFLATGNSRGSITPSGDFGISNPVSSNSGGVTVNVFPIEGTTANIQQSNDGRGGLKIDILMEHIDAKMSEGIVRGTSETSKTLSNVFALNRAHGGF